MSRAPAFQFYANDFMDATRLWDANACGLYVRCMCIQWTHGSIPADLKVLARAIHCDLAELQSVWPVVGPKFIDQGDGTLKNKRLEEVRERQQHVSGKRSEAAKARWEAHAFADANAMHLHLQRKVKEKKKVEGEQEGVKGEPQQTVPVEPLTDQQRADRAAAPDHPFSSSAFRLAWFYFEQSRKASRHPMTAAARSMILRKMSSWTEAEAIEALNASVRSGWRDVFRPKGEPASRLVPHDPGERRNLNTTW